MTIEIVPVPCLSDNFAYLVRDAEAPGASGGARGVTAVVDIPEARPILAALDERGWTLDEAWITHHHDDHVQGLGEVRAAHGVAVTGAEADARRLPPLDRAVAPGVVVDFGTASVEVMDVPGHTVGHVAYHVPAARAAFTADSLMAMGCGRLFEGTPEQMWATLSLLDGLPGDTVIYSGHDYLEKNLGFALTVEPDNAALRERAERDARRRSQGRLMEHPTLDEERATNPMLRAGRAEVKAALGMRDAPDVEVFAEIRRRRDRF